MDEMSTAGDPAVKQYPMDPVKEAQVARAFTYHPPKADQPARYNALRAQAHELARAFVDLTPPGREQALALTKLEEAVMWANAAIARGE
jgi:hypothetical protein